MLNIRNITILCSLMFAPAKSVVIRNYCDVLPNFPMNYTKEILVNIDSNAILDIDVSHRSGNIYFVDSQFKFGVLRRGEAEKRVIDIIDTDVTALAIDNDKGPIYVGCKTGLKTYDENTGLFEDVPNMKNYIRHIFLSKHSPSIYAVMDDYDLYRFQSLTTRGDNLNIKIDDDMPHAFATDIDDNYFYSININGNGLTQMKLKYYPNKPITLCDGTFFSLASDNKETVYGLASRGLYRLKANDTVPRLMTVLDFVAGCLSFDKNNDVVVGSTDGSIVLLKIDEKNHTPPPLGPIYKPIVSEKIVWTDDIVWTGESARSVGKCKDKILYF